MSIIRLRRGVLDGGRFHVVTSPDMKGLHVTADTAEQADHDVREVVGKILELPQFRERYGAASEVSFTYV